MSILLARWRELPYHQPTLNRQSVPMSQPDDHENANLQKITLFGRTFALPRSRLARISAGIALIIGGILGFLPVLGFWMVPLGVIVLSHDIPAVRRFRRKFWVEFNRWRARRRDENK